jgi:hypothetical protein
MVGAFKIEAVHAATAKSFAEIERERAAEAATERQPDWEGGAVEEVA